MLNWDSNKEADWNCAVAKYNTYLIDEEKAARDSRVTSINASIISSLSVIAFKKYLEGEFFIWKYTNPKYRASYLRSFNTMSMEELEDIKRNLSDASLPDEELYKTAKHIKGLGTAGATALLSTLYPHRFGTVDQFVVKCLQRAKSLSGDPIIQEINPQAIKDTEALYVENLLQAKAKELNELFDKVSWTPRQVDKAAFADR